MAVSAMTKDEAMRILNVSEATSRDEMIGKFQHLFRVNDKRVGGSLYLQSKVIRAREALETVFPEGATPK